MLFVCIHFPPIPHNLVVVCSSGISARMFQQKYEHLLFLLSKVYVFPLSAASNTGCALACALEWKRDKKTFSVIISPQHKKKILFVIINYLVCERLLSEASTTGKNPIINGKENTNSAFGVMKWREIVAIFQTQLFLQRCKLLKFSSGTFLCARVDADAGTFFPHFKAAIQQKL